MNFQDLVGRLYEMFPKSKSDLELYIESKEPKTASDIEHWQQQYTYRTSKDWFLNA